LGVVLSLLTQPDFSLVFTFVVFVFAFALPFVFLTFDFFTGWAALAA